MAYNGYLKHLEPVILGMYSEGYSVGDIARTLYRAGARTQGDHWDEYAQLGGLRGMIKHILGISPKRRGQNAREIRPVFLN